MGCPSPCYAVVTRLARPGRRLADVTGPLPPERVQQGGAAAVPPEREGVVHVRRQVALHASRQANKEDGPQHEAGDEVADSESAAALWLGWLLRGKGLLGLHGGWWSGGRPWVSLSGHAPCK